MRPCLWASAAYQTYFQLAGISKDIQKFTGDSMDRVDRHFASVASSIREGLATASWIPEVARPTRPPPPRAILRPPPGYVERAQDWVSRNRAITAAVVAFFATGGFLVYRQRKQYGRKRRARRASNGARREVAGIVHLHKMSDEGTEEWFFSQLWPDLQARPSRNR